jgi:hypothetical protein
MAKNWCLGCNEWVDPVKRGIEIGRDGGTGHERAPSQSVEMCPNDDGTASGHLLVGVPPA